MVQIRLDRSVLREEKTYAKSLPSLKKLVDEKFAIKTQGIEGKAKAQTEAEELK